MLAAAGAGTATPPSRAPSNEVEVVVTLPQPPLAAAIARDRSLAARATVNRRLDVRAPASRSYLRSLATAQRALQSRLAARIPSARVSWHYGVVANGLAVTVPRSQLDALRRLRGVTVWPSVTYRSLLNKTPQLIGATTVWGSTLATAGQGVKIAVIDDGVDQRHEFFSPAGFSYPPGFPKGNTAYTTPKVIVAKAFAPPSTSWKYARTPFDPQQSDHATNVAGIAAGDHDTVASLPNAKVRVSGIAPAAYIGNYKVLTVPTEGFGLDGNSPEIVKGIEEAVKDGMDVLNLSLGEPEVEPTRDIVVAALERAAQAGVVPVVAAGNDFAEAGKGGVGSPSTAPSAISVAASTEGDSGPADVIAGFSDSGPTPMSLQLKPDVTAPGVNILSSLPRNEWSNHDWSGTSMAAPHVAGAVAVLKQRHPAWTVAQIKSALESTGAPVRSPASTAEVSVLREGGGRIDLVRADNPLVFTSPTSVSYGLVKRGTTTTQQIDVADAGGGPAPWSASVAPQATPAGVAVAPAAATVTPGTPVGLTLTVAADADEGDAVGFLLLRRGTDTRRVPYWAHVEVPRLATEPHITLRAPGTFGGNTAGKASRVSSYRYPENGLASNSKTGVQTNLSGPEQVFRIHIAKPVANFGAAVLSTAKGVRVSPRVVVAGDENRLLGYTAIPVNLNPYQDYGRVEPVVGAVLPKPGDYDIVFDTPVGAKPGKFTFRYWVNDVTPPTVRVLPSPARTIRLRVADAGSGVDPGSMRLRVNGVLQRAVIVHGVVAVRNLRRGPHRVTVTVSDYQEAKNMENVGPILPNTTRFSRTIRVR
ncbi:MAG TPA: S8 family serine peptidase [Gaiellaceae bacterium]|nr:S8 family serine peptidase [Gaiellaceae bacterium]